jgi:hypothetical protein
MLTMSYVNAQSISNLSHLLTVKNLLYNKCIDLFFITETWLNDMDSDDYLKIEGYNIIRKDRVGKRGGGVCIYIKQTLDYKILFMSPTLFDNKPEFIIFDISLAKIKILCSVVYRRPKGESIQNYFNELGLILPKYDHCILCGDININLNNETAPKRKFMENLSDLNLQHLPLLDTHATASSISTIDFIAISNRVTALSYGKLAVPELSNHDLLYCVYPVNVPIENEKIIQYRDYNRIYSDSLCEAFSSLNWNLLLGFVNINTKVEYFTKQIVELFDKFAPMKYFVQKKEKKPWITSDIIKSVKLRDIARKRWANNKSMENWKIYNNLKKKVKQEIKKSLRKFMHCNIDVVANSSKVLWMNLRKCGLVKDNSLYQPPVVNADELINVFTVSHPHNIPLVNATCQYYNNNLLSNIQNSEKFYFSDVTPVVIKDVIKYFSSNAYGDDNISIKMLKPISDLLLPVLDHLFNYSLQYSCFPDHWKYAIVKPVPKVFKPNSASDYRPISILSVVGKILEKIVHDQISTFVLSNNILDMKQSGFRKSHSTCSALLRISEDIRLAMGRGDVTIIVLFDFSKAFDCVLHDLLLCKLKYLNFSPSAISWMRSYITDRKQRIICSDSSSSEWLPLNCGVPQGSVLGPLLYSLYTFDIGTCFINSNYHMYADDLQIYLHGKPEEINKMVRLINEDILRLINYTEKHGLTLNSLKTQAMIIRSPSQCNLDPNTIDKVSVNNIEVPYSTKIKNLGITMDEYFSWTHQVSAICQKIYLSLNRLYKFRSLTPHNTRVKLVNTLVLPIIDYCIIVFCNMSEEDLNRLQVAQNNAIRYIFDVKRREHITPYYSKLGWLKVRERRDLQICIMTHKILHGYAPAYLTDLFTVMGNVRSRATRAHCNYLLAPVVGRKISERSFSVMGYRLWNNLSAELCTMKATAIFKNKLELKFLSTYITAKY